MTAKLQAPPLRSRPISRSWRNLLLSAHIVASVGLLGTDAAVLTLNLAGWRDADPRTIYPAAHLIGLWLLLPLAVASVLTGLILGLLTTWGITRYWWVSIKLVLNLAGLVLALSVLLPVIRIALEHLHDPRGDLDGGIGPSAARTLAAARGMSGRASLVFYSPAFQVLRSLAIASRLHPD